MWLVPSFASSLRDYDGSYPLENVMMWYPLTDVLHIDYVIVTGASATGSDACARSGAAVGWLTIRNWSTEPVVLSDARADRR